MALASRRQLVLDSALQVRTAHGGEHSIKGRKEARPIATKRSMHIVMRAEVARGKLSLLNKRNSVRVKQLVQSQSRKWFVRVYEWSNNGNHIHLLVRAKTRDGFQGFLRAFSGTIAMAVTGARKGQPFGRRFWDLLAYSRIVEWGRAFLNARNYVILNREEAEGRVPYRRSGSRYEDRARPGP